MCGIVGLVTKSTNGCTAFQQELFAEMLVCDAIRGEDSTGIFAVNNSGNVTYIKLASHPFNLLKTSEYLTLKQDSWNSGRILVGHNRKASSGAISNENAHPFAFGPIVLVHNGFIDNFRSLVHHKEREKNNIEVDSHALTSLLARNDPMKIIPELKGAFVIIWYNATEKKLYFVRNTERPFSLVDINDGIYFASEKGMLRWLLHRHQAKAEIAEIKPGVLLSLDENNVWENRPVKLYEKPAVFVPKEYAPPATNGEIVYLPNQIKQVPKTIDMKLEESFNIHYGDDHDVDLTNAPPFPQIVFSVDDYKKVSEDHVNPPVWRLWGKALDSEQIDVYCQFRGTETQCDEYAYQAFLTGHISRVSDRIINNQQGQAVYCLHPKLCEITATSDNFAITTEHLAYLQNKSKCTCGHVEISTMNDEDKVVMRLGFETQITCKWCLVNTPECKELCKEPGQCQYCVGEKQKEEGEKLKNIAVQARK